MTETEIRGDGDENPELDELAHDVLEQIASEVRTIRCPVHGTPPKITVGNGGISLETCCEALDEAVDAAFPEGDEDDPDLVDEEE